MFNFIIIKKPVTFTIITNYNEPIKHDQTQTCWTNSKITLLVAASVSILLYWKWYPNLECLLNPFVIFNTEYIILHFAQLTLWLLELQGRQWSWTGETSRRPLTVSVTRVDLGILTRCIHLYFNAVKYVVISCTFCDIAPSNYILTEVIWTE